MEFILLIYALMQICTIIQDVYTNKKSQLIPAGF